MSFILDALKKSEAERQRQAAPMTFEAPTARPHRGVPTWVITAGALLVLVNLVGLVWLMLRKTPAPGTAAGTAPPAAVVANAVVPNGGSNTNSAAARAGDNATPAIGANPATAGGEAVSPALLVPPEAEPPAPEVPEDAHIAALKRYATLGSSAPSLRLDLHVYSSNPADRYALINMRKLREGDTSEDGIKVKEITRSGVVLLYRGEELLLSRD